MKAMRSETLRGRVLPLACSAGCLAALLALASGCGTSAYSEQFDKRLSELQKVSAFAALGKATDHLPVNLRAPLSMIDPGRVYNLYSADPLENSKYVARDRVLPPFMPDGVGFKMTFEGKYSQNVANSAPYFLYVWMFDAAKSKDGLDTIRNLLRTRLQDPKADWQPVEVRTPDGKTLTWKRLHLHGQQDFELVRSGNAATDSNPGVFELWYFDAPGWDVLLGWRATDDAWEKATSGDAKLSDLPEIVAGTIKFKDDETRAKKPAPPTYTWVAGPTAAPKVASGTGPTTPDNTTPNPNPPPSDSTTDTPMTTTAAAYPGTVQVAASGPSAPPFTITYPPNWEQAGTSAQLKAPNAPAGSLPNIVAVETRQLSEVTATAKLFDEVQTQFTDGFKDPKTVDKGDFRTEGMRGEFRVITGTENDKPRKMILCFLRKGPTLVIIQGLFNESEYDTLKPVFDGFAKSFKLASPAAIAKALISDPRLVPENEANHHSGLRFSIRFPKEWPVLQRPDYSHAVYHDPTKTSGDLPVRITVRIHQLDNENVAVVKFMDLFEAFGPHNKTDEEDQLEGPYKVVERGELEIDGQPAVFCVGTYNRRGQPRRFMLYMVKNGIRLAEIFCDVEDSEFEKQRTLFKAAALTFHFE